MLDFISVCAGIGGIDLGFESVGMRCVAQIEIDDYATKILEARWPNTPRFRDIRRTSARTLPRAQVLAGGIPCQPHSVSGKRQGMHDERDLWPEFFRLLVNTQPRYAVIENVVGITTSNHGEHFGRILAEMAAAGFDAEWVRLRASQVGARHRRERVWIVAYPTGDKLQGRALRAAQRGQNARKKQLSRLLFAGIEDAVSAARIFRGNHGFSTRLDASRNKAIGNAVVPHCAAIIGQAILDHYERTTNGRDE